MVQWDIFSLDCVIKCIRIGWISAPAADADSWLADAWLAAATGLLVVA
jgi:hypothetical protein